MSARDRDAGGAPDPVHGPVHGHAFGPVLGPSPDRASADAHLAGLAGMPRAAELLTDDGLSAALGRAVTATRMRLKPGRSLALSWRAAEVGTSGVSGDAVGDALGEGGGDAPQDPAGDPMRDPERHGWCLLTTDAQKVTNALRRAERAGRPGEIVRSAGEADSLLAGSVWTDPQLSVELDRARRRLARRGAPRHSGVGAGAGGGPGAGWQLLRYNPSRRVLAHVRVDGAPHVLRVHPGRLDGPGGMVDTVRRWREAGLPVLPLRRLGGKGTAAISPFWGTGDLLAVPRPAGAEAAGNALARAHAALRTGQHAVQHAGQSAVLPADRQAGGGSMPSSVSDVPVMVRDSADSVALHAPWLAEAVAGLAELLPGLLDLAAAQDVRTELHGDFSPDQVLADGSDGAVIRIIDLDRAGTGRALRDVGSWAASCRMAGLDGEPIDMIEPFLEGYRAGGGLPHAASVSAWEAYALLSSALEPMRHRVPDWPQQVQSRIELALVAAEAANVAASASGEAPPAPATSAVTAPTPKPAAPTRAARTPTPAAPASTPPSVPRQDDAAVPSTAVAEGREWFVDRAWPDSEGALTVEVRPLSPTTDDPLRAGRWCDGVLNLIPAGTDHTLAALPEVLGEPAAVVVSHRPHRRAVIRHTDRATGALRFTKVVRRNRAQRILDGIRRAAPFAAGFRMPDVVSTTDSTVTFTALAGASLHNPSAFTPRDWARAWTDVADGLQVARRHQAPAEPDPPGAPGAGGAPGIPAIPVHSPTDEADVLTDWTCRSAPWIADRADWERTVRAVTTALESLPESATVPTHRDLHDKQLLWTPAGGPGLLDVDTACLADPALDLGNLRAHARWRVRQGVWAPDWARVVTDAVDALARSTGVPTDGVAVYELAALARLRCVYATRPRYAATAERLQAELTTMVHRVTIRA